jgi:hypothetical protein
MKQYCITITINVFVEADNELDAHSKWDNINVDFTDRNSGEPIDYTFIDSDLFEVDAD